MSERLVLHEREFSGAKSIKTVAEVNKAFQLGVDTDLNALAADIQDVLDVLRSPV